MISGKDLRILNKNQEIGFKDTTNTILRMKVVELCKILNTLKFMQINNTNAIQINSKYSTPQIKQGKQITDLEINMWSKIKNLTENEKIEIETLLWNTKKIIFYNRGYKNINGAYSDYEIIDYDDGIIFVKITVGVQDIGDFISSSELFTYQFRIKRTNLEILDQFDF